MLPRPRPVAVDSSRLATLWAHGSTTLARASPAMPP
jgi:hypothetical protein